MEKETSKGSNKIMNREIIKLDQFDGSNFGCWKDKMIFFLTAMKLFYILDPHLTPLPEPTNTDTEKEKDLKVEAR